jgi:lipopolysaccharide biosynthesis regulator YciM
MEPAMGLMSFLFGDRPRRGGPEPLLPLDGYAPVSQDTMAAINELSRVVKNNPDAVEIYLALGNLYRSHGEIERAVQIRNNLIVRPGLDNRFKGRAWYELGRDYKRGGFLDRAHHAFEEARGLLGDEEPILVELAALAAVAGDFETAARHYERLGHRVAQAHFMVRRAQQAYAEGEESAARRWLSRGLKVYPGSVEGWLTRLELARRAGDWNKVGAELRLALANVPPDLRFVLLEELIRQTRETSPLDGQPRASGAGWEAGDVLSLPEAKLAAGGEADMCRAVIPVLEEQPPDLLLEYYGAWIYLLCGDVEKAKGWFERTLVVNPDFWPARLELLALAAREQPLSSVFEVQLGFFIGQARHVKRFVCRTCGLRREQVFFSCPRCRSWHSIGFRLELSD